MNNTPRALSGIRVLDLSDIKGAWAGRMLADLGADVIRVEPTTGDPMRAMAPFFGGQPGPARSLTYWFYNAGKRAIELSPEQDTDADQLRTLAAASDIFIESLPPGRLAESGLGYEDLSRVSPRLIYVSITPFGQGGPLANNPAEDITLCAMGGMMYINGNPQSSPLVSFGLQSYHVGSYFGVISALAALRGRRLTGRGQFIDVSIEAAIAAFIEHVNVWYLANRRIAKRQGSLHWSRSFATFRAADGYVNLSYFHQWPVLVAWLLSEDAADDLADDAYNDLHFASSRLEHISDVLARWVASKTVDELFREGQERRFPWAGVYDIAKVFRMPQLRERGFWTPVEHDDLGGTFEYPGAPFHLSATPWAISRRPPLPAEHNGEVLGNTRGNSAHSDRLRRRAGKR